MFNNNVLLLSGLFFLQLPILKEAGLDKIQKQKFVCKKLAQKTNYQAKDKKKNKKKTP